MYLMVRLHALDFFFQLLAGMERHNPTGFDFLQIGLVKEQFPQLRLVKRRCFRGFCRGMHDVCVWDGYLAESTNKST